MNARWIAAVTTRRAAMIAAARYERRVAFECVRNPPTIRLYGSPCKEH